MIVDLLRNDSAYSKIGSVEVESLRYEENTTVFTWSQHKGVILSISRVSATEEVFPAERSGDK